MSRSPPKIRSSSIAREAARARALGHLSPTFAHIRHATDASLPDISLGTS